MTIRLRFFASLRERLKMSDATHEAAAGATAADVWSALCREHPDLEPLSGSVSFAVNREYVERLHPLHDGDELALIPPVSGGAASSADNSSRSPTNRQALHVRDRL
ncbi:MAG: molybdopterin converting factor subunit 1 [bacterium]